MNLELKNLKVGYSTHSIFKDAIDLTIDNAGLILVLGKNGAGKSTLLKSLLGFLPLINGEVLRKGNLGWAPTDNRGFFPHLTGFENLLFYWEESDQQKMNFEEYLNRFSSIVLINDLLNKKYDQMSSGMKQILKLVLAFYPSKEIICLDEPLKSLAPEVEDLILEIIRLFSSEKIILIADHVETKYTNLSYRKLNL